MIKLSKNPKTKKMTNSAKNTFFKAFLGILAGVLGELVEFLSELSADNKTIEVDRWRFRTSCKFKDFSELETKTEKFEKCKLRRKFKLICVRG